MTAPETRTQNLYDSNPEILETFTTWACPDVSSSLLNVDPELGTLFDLGFTADQIAIILADRGTPHTRFKKLKNATVRGLDRYRLLDAPDVTVCRNVISIWALNSEP